MWPPDHAKAVENAYAAVDAFAAHMGLVEVELMVGEEPEDGVGFEVHGVAWDETLKRP